MSIAASQTVQKRIRWKAGKEDELWSYVQTRTAAGVSISEALKTFADKNGISWLTARWKYYRLRQDRDTDLEASEEIAPHHSQASLVAVPQPYAPTQLAPMGASRPAPNSLHPDEAFEALSRFLSSASKIESLDLAGLLTGMSNLAGVALKGDEAVRESATVRQQYNELQQQLAEYRRRLAQVRFAYDALATSATDWLDLHSVDRVTRMGEFAKKLDVQVEELNRALALAEGI